MTNSSPEMRTSVPEYLPIRIRSPFFTSIGTRLPSSVRPRSHRHHLALLGLLLGGIGDDDASTLRLLLFHAPDQEPVCEGLHVHGSSLGMRSRRTCRHGESP